VPRRPRNPDPALHPFERAVEEKRALNAVKLERVFAKPFVGVLGDGHLDGAYALARSRRFVSRMVSGSADGEIAVWNLMRREADVTIKAHRGFVRGLAVSTTVLEDEGERYFSCGDDKTVKIWSVAGVRDSGKPTAVFRGTGVFYDVDTHWKDRIFCSAGQDGVDIWDESRSEPVENLKWGPDSVTKVVFNPVEKDILASCGADRSIALYDVRLQTPVRKVILRMKSNSLAWNPMEAFNFVIANEDGNLYSYDMRKLKDATCVHTDHVMAVMDVDFSPTGREFVSASYDKTIRIFKFNGGRSRDVYHTKRMQRVFAVKLSADSRFILSASDDGDLRLWKAQASRPIKPLLPREKESLDYNQKLKQRFHDVPEIRRIQRHRHVPKVIKNLAKEKEIVKKSRQRKEKNLRAHSTPGTVPVRPTRKKHVVRELE